MEITHGCFPQIHWQHDLESSSETFGTSCGPWQRWKQIIVLKPEEEWTTTEDKLSLANSKALNVLFNGVGKNMFRMIKQCTIAKDAWEILKTSHEGTSKVKISRLQLLTTKFENLKMKEDENIQDYYMNVLDIADSFDSLGEKLTDEPILKNWFIGIKLTWISLKN